MISISFNLSNPFSCRYEAKTLVSTLITEHKNLEIEYSRDNTIIDFWFRWTFRQSHAGIMIGFGLLSHSLYITIDDIRHWDKDKQTWENDDDFEGC